ncbi:MAG: signal peptidase I [Lachnospiraceae bacterium]|nr:signal peptidase I [Lachnospiraceae bacterium]MDE6624786.1 signal peptidase I [Lachnospiraceae bacterium]
MRRRRRYRSSYDRKEFDVKDFLSEVGQWAISILIVIILAYSIVTFGVQSVTVIGRSMNPALDNQDVVLLNKSAYTFSSPERYDIIAFKLKEETDGYFNIKRIIGLPGEKIQIKNGHVFINGSALTDLPFEDLIMTEGLAIEEVSLGEGEYFVMGDNCNNSEDSRYVNIGNISAKEISGRVFFRISPKNEFGVVK